MAIQAIMAIRQMQGGSQARLVSGSDGGLWVAKFQNNPQHIRVLANEYIATGLAAEVGLPVPDTEIIEISSQLHAASAGLEADFVTGRKELCAPGLHFGSRFVGGDSPGSTVGYLPPIHFAKVVNLADFAGVLALDKWTCNGDWRQCVFRRELKTKRYRAIFIDQGCCFDSGNWAFPDSPLLGIYGLNTAYAHIKGWEDFSPWLERLEQFDPSILWGISKGVPPEWYGGETEALERLCDQLLKRRSRIRELILAFRNSDRSPFPCWVKPPIITIPEMPTQARRGPIDYGLQIAKR